MSNNTAILENLFAQDYSYLIALSYLSIHFIFINALELFNENVLSHLLNVVSCILYAQLKMEKRKKTCI